MAMTAADILAHPALAPCVRGQAQSLLQIQQASPRIASLFATQQRWLMSHAALFTWVDEGGILMDRLIVGYQQGADRLARIPTDVTSISGVAQRFNLSRTQAATLPRPRRREAWAGRGGGEISAVRGSGANIMSRRP